MRKNYNKPRLVVEKMDFSLLVEVSSIPVKEGKTGSFDAKEGYLDFSGDDLEDE